VSCYLVQETDGTSRFTLEDASGFLLLEFCPPAGGTDFPVGDSHPGLPLADLGPANPVRRGRRRRLEIITDEEELISVLLDV
jgi:hypothetical protein